MAVAVVPSVATVQLAWLSRGVVVLVLVLVLELGLWLGFWWRWGRYWHPIKELRWELSQERAARCTPAHDYEPFDWAWWRCSGNPNRTPDP